MGRVEGTDGAERNLALETLARAHDQRVGVGEIFCGAQFAKLAGQVAALGQGGGGIVRGGGREPGSHRQQQQRGGEPARAHFGSSASLSACAMWLTKLALIFRRASGGTSSQSGLFCSG